MRTYFRQRLRNEELLTAAYSLESVLIELIFIVGPLLRPEVEEVALQQGFVPTLALNYVQDPRPTGGAFFQFGLSPEDEALLADAVGTALAVVLDTLAPAERVSFVLHDMFGVPFDDVAGILGRTPAATRQLASRARRRVQGGSLAPDVGLGAQRAVVDAFFAAARRGDNEALVAVLDPDVVLQADGGAAAGGTVVVVGAQQVAARAMTFSRCGPDVYPALVNGAAGVVVDLVARGDIGAKSVAAFQLRCNTVFGAFMAESAKINAIVIIHQPGFCSHSM